MKKIVTLLVVLISILGTSNIFSLANEVSIEPEVILTGEATDQNAPISIMGLYYSDGFSRLYDQGGGKVAVYGETNALTNVDEIKVTMVLKMLVNGTWQSVNSWNYTAYSNSYVSGTKEVTVTRGYYYYVESTHSIKKGSTYESGTSNSSAIFIY